MMPSMTAPAKTSMVISQAQVLAGRFLNVAPAELAEDIRGLAAHLRAESHTPSERAVACAVLNQLLSRLAHHASIDRQPRVASAFVDLAAEPPWGESWWLRWAAVVHACQEALDQPGAATHVPHVAAHARRLLAMIERRYHEPALRLKHIANDSHGISPCYAARIIKQCTGSGFVDHVRRLRIEAAERLLTETNFSIKEVTAKVGYRTSQQLILNFKRLNGVTPKTYRSSRSRCVTPAAMTIAFPSAPARNRHE